MSRDRDPFERAIEQLRVLLRSGEGLQGRPLAINVLAQSIGVSQTPVREALAWLAGEGLIVRTHTGYVGRTFEATTLAELYRLNLAHVLAALSSEARLSRPLSPGSARRAAWPIVEGGDPNGVFDVLVSLTGDRTLLASLRRTREPLSPFMVDEALMIEDAVAVMRELEAGYPNPASLRAVARGFYGRRARGAPLILAATLERLQI